MAKPTSSAHSVEIAPHSNLIGGKWLPARSGETFRDVNPANTEDVLGDFPRSGEADISAAVAAAAAAFKPWRLVPAPQRGNLLRQCAARLTEIKETLARLMSREMGKPIVEARGDVQEAID